MSKLFITGTNLEQCAQTKAGQVGMSELSITDKMARCTQIKIVYFSKLWLAWVRMVHAHLPHTDKMYADLFACLMIIMACTKSLQPECSGLVPVALSSQQDCSCVACPYFKSQLNLLAVSFQNRAACVICSQSLPTRIPAFSTSNYNCLLNAKVCSSRCQEGLPSPLFQFQCAKANTVKNSHGGDLSWQLRYSGRQ